MSDTVDGLVIVGDGGIDTLFGVLRHLDGREYFLDLALDIVDVDIADNNDALKVGTIPGLVVVAKSLRLEVVDNFHGADRQAVAIFQAGIERRKNLLENALRAFVAAAPFFVDNAALLVDLIRFEKKSVGPVVENEQA